MVRFSVFRKPVMIKLKNNASSMSRAVMHHFEFRPKYSFWGARTGFWKMQFKALALIAVLGWLAFEGAELFKTQHTILALSSQIQDLRQQSIAVKTKQQQKAQVPVSTLSSVQIRGYNTVIRQLNVPWKHVFKDLEAMTPLDVALISIEPDGARSTIKLVAEAKSLTTLLRYSSQLQHNGIFDRITYSKHETNEQDANKPIRLSFELELRQLEIDLNKLVSNESPSKVGQK
jgi:Tfp pilus assembly protein PilN